MKKSILKAVLLNFLLIRKCNLLIKKTFAGNRTGRWGLDEVLNRVQNDHQDPILSTLKQVFKESICENPVQTLKKIENPGGLQYQQIFSSPWAPSIDLEKRHEELTKKICQWPVDHIKSKLRTQIHYSCMQFNDYL